MTTEGQLLWKPCQERIENAEISRFMRWLNEERGLQLKAYHSLWQWSVDDVAEFWAAFWEYCEIKSSHD